MELITLMNMSDHSRMLVVGDGDVASILACAAASDAALIAEPDAEKRRGIRPVLWTPAFSGPTGSARQWAIRRQAELFEMELVESPGISAGAASPRIAAKDLASDIAADPSGEWPAHSRDLIAASIAGIARGCAVVVWPMHSTHTEGPDLDEVSRAVDRALLVSRLIALDADAHGNPSFRVDVPYVDFSDRQLADLVIDMDLPVRLCWWWHAEMASGVDGLFRAQHARWTTVLREVGWRIDLADARSASRSGTPLS